MSRRCTRRVGQDSPDRPGNGKVTFNSLSLKSCATGPASRTSTARPTACTAGCELARYSGSFLGVKASGPDTRLWLRTTRRLASPKLLHRASQRGTIGTRAATVCGGSGKSARLHRPVGNICLDFLMTRDRASFLLFRRATQLPRELYEVLGVYKYTWLARLHGGSTLT